MASLTKFQVTNFRNIHNSGWIEDIGRVTALLGQNESGTSNLCEALYKLYPFDDAKYDYEFDWPVDLWGEEILTGDKNKQLRSFSILLVNIDEFLKRGETPVGRTLRSFDKRQASGYLTRKFQELWKQKQVEFDIDIDGPTLNIFVKDVGFAMPGNSTGAPRASGGMFRFAWRFTHATAGEFKDVIILLEEPGIHLHPAGQRDLIDFFDELGRNNQVIYTTYLPYMIDTGTPERVRIVEIRNHHTRVIRGIVAPSRQPMIVIETALGLSPSMSDLLGHRATLIVEGTDDFVILNKLNRVIFKVGGARVASGRLSLASARSVQSPMYAGFLIGHGLAGGVLLDSDDAGRTAAKKIKELYGTAIENFPVMTLGPAVGQRDACIAIEDLLPGTCIWIAWVEPIKFKSRKLI